MEHRLAKDRSHRCRRQAPPSRGFTLAELIIVLALTSIITIGMGAALMIGTRSIGMAEDLIVETNADEVVAQIKADTRMATSI
ncbi:MAG: type II secretion system protein, partial [Planctomycetota bacterium]